MEMLLVFYRFTIVGNREAFEQAYREQKALQAQLSGPIGEMLVHSTSYAASYSIVSKWNTPDFYDWQQSPEYAVTERMLDRFKHGEVTVEKYVIVEV